MPFQRACRCKISGTSPVEQQPFLLIAPISGAKISPTKTPQLSLERTASSVLGFSRTIAMHAISAAYYACTTAGCSGSAVTTAQVLKNPVALFLHDNNGVLIDLPAVSNSGSAGVSGSLIFGIGTQGNNALSTAVIYSTDSSGNFTTSYTPVGTVTPATLTSFIDSGSNGLFFRDAGIPIGTLSAGFYCPPSPLSLILLCHQIWQDVGIA